MLWRDRRAAADPGRRLLCGSRAFDFGRVQNDDAADQKRDAVGLLILLAVFIAIGWCGCRCRRIAMASRSASASLISAVAGERMNSDNSPVSTLVWTFGLMSLFAVGGATQPYQKCRSRSRRSALDERQTVADIFAISSCRRDRMC
jgi:hypothetical protein